MLGLTYKLTHTRTHTRKTSIRMPWQRLFPCHVHSQSTSVSYEYSCVTLPISSLLNPNSHHCECVCTGIETLCWLWLTNFQAHILGFFICFTISSYSLLSCMRYILFHYIFGNEFDEGTIYIFFSCLSQGQICAHVHAPKTEFNWLETFSTRIMAI